MTTSENTAVIPEEAPLSTEEDFTRSEAQASSDGPTEDYWKPLDADAFELWQAFCQMIGGHTPLVWDGLTAYARLITDETRGLTEDELRVIVHKADVPAGHEKCSECDRPAVQLETALIFPNGKIKTLFDGTPVMRGAYLLVPRTDGSGKVDATRFCHACMKQVREVAKAEGVELHPMAYKDATWRAEKINAGIDLKKATANKFVGRFGRPTGQVSAPRNSPSNIGDRR